MASTPPSQSKPKKDQEEQELSPEDLQKKESIELMVTRLSDEESGVQKLAIESLRQEIKNSSASISSIPKGLKFLRPHYNTLKDVWQNTEGDNRKYLADVISVLAMTMSTEGSLDSLKFRLEGSTGGIEEWGHEYVRNLSGEIIQEFASRSAEEKSVDDLINLVDQIVPFNMKHNAEPEACDLLLEVEKLPDVMGYTDENNFDRIALYLLGNVAYSTEPENFEILKIVLGIYKKHNRHCEAFFVAMLLDDPEIVQDVYDSVEDPLIKKQLAFMAGRQRAFFLNEDDDEFGDLIGNMKLSQFYRELARDLSVEEAKAPKDIYKMHLIENRHLANMKIDSAKQNLADGFVNAFVNAGFGTDALLMSDSDRQYVFKTKDSGRMSVVASMGLINLWDADEGCRVLDSFFYSHENPILAGALLGVGITNAGTRNVYDLALSLVGQHVKHQSNTVRIGAILGLGMSYAGSAHEELSAMLSEILAEPDVPMDVLSITAYSLGLIFVGTCNADIAGLISDILFSKSEEQFKSPYAKFLCLGLGLLYLGKQSMVDVTLETLRALEGPFAKYAQFTVETCAYAGTGNVLKVQELSQACGEHLEKDFEFQAVAVLGISLIALGEEIGMNMAIRAFNHLLQYGEPVIRRTVPLALGLISISNPQLQVMDTLSKLSHDSDGDVAQSAIFALGMIGAGTNNSRIAGLLRNLSAYYCKDRDQLFTVRIAQGLLHLGKGLLTLNPYHCHQTLVSKVGLAGILGVLHACFDFNGLIHDEGHYLLYLFCTAMQPRMLMLLDEDLKPIEASVRVGQAVDTVGQAGKPKSITGFQTHTAPVLIANGERAELATDDYITSTMFLEDCVIVKPNPEATSTNTAN